MRYKVTVYSNWVSVTEEEFDSLEEANEYAQEMRHQQYKVILDEIEEPVKEP